MKVGTLGQLGHLGQFIRAAALGLSILGAAGIARPAFAQTGDKVTDAKVDPAKAEKRDLIIFQNGSKAEGVVIEETETTVRFLLILGSMRSETTYNKSEILEIKRNEFKPADPKATKDAKDAKDTKPSKSDGDTGVPTGNEGGGNMADKIVDINGKAIDPGAQKVYVLPIRGELGRDTSRTPLRAAMDDIVRVQPDVLVVRFDNEFAQYGEAKQDFEVDTYQYDMLETARELDTLLLDRIELGSEFKKKPHTVAWVKKAMGGAAFLPFTFKEIYFTSDGRHGALGAVEIMFQGRGDEVVRQKQRSLRVGRAKGLCAKGGHDERIMTAMSWAETILCYRIVGGQVEFREEMPPGPEWFLLKDDGAINKDHADTMQDRIRLKGNDFLTLDAKTAYAIGFSNGTADSLDELLNLIGITRNYAVVRGQANKIFTDWSKNVDKNETEVTKLIAAYRAVEVKAPGGYDQRTEARGRQIRYLQQIQSIVKVYREALNPQRIGSADGLIDDLDVLIDRIKTSQTLDRRP